MHFHLILVVAFLITFTGQAGSTWGDVKKKCPVCGEVEYYATPVSSPRETTRSRSKYHYVFWPHTDSRALFSCVKCHYTAYMWDFDKIPEDKKAALRDKLANTKTKVADHYNDVPMPRRMELAKVYYELLAKDDLFWCQFYRSVAYWADQDDKAEAGAAARKQALVHAEKLLKDPKYAKNRKENLVIYGSLLYWLGEKTKAWKAFKAALTVHSMPDGMKPDEATKQSRFLSKLASRFIKSIEEDKPIRRK